MSTGSKNDIRVTKIKSLTSYLTYIYHLFTDEVHFDNVTINAIGNAISKAVALAELCRLRIPALFTIIDIGFVDLADRDVTKRVTSIKILLSKKQLDKNHTGYMEPLPLDKVQEYKSMPPHEHGYEDEEEGEDGRYHRRSSRRAYRPRYRDHDHEHEHEHEHEGHHEDWDDRRDDGERRRRGGRRTRRRSYREYREHAE